MQADQKMSAYILNRLVSRDKKQTLGLAKTGRSRMCAITIFCALESKKSDIKYRQFIDFYKETDILQAQISIASLFCL